MKRRVPILFAIIVLAMTVRALTGNFVRDHINDAAWFQYGSYELSDRNAQDIIDGRTRFFWIDDPSRTDRIVYPPGFPWFIAFVYEAVGDRSPVSVLNIQLFLDSLAVILLVGIGVSAYGWGTGYAAGVLGAISPLMAMYGVSPAPDAVTSWFILASVWCLVLAARQLSWQYAAAAGVLLGLACWFRVNPLFLFVAWTAALLIITRGGWTTKIKLSAAVSLAAVLVLSPLVIRNLVVFYPEIAPTGLGIGWNLLAGIGETDRGAEFGVPCCDAGIVEQDRQSMGLAGDAPLELNFPDGISRDRERGSRAVGIIASHPIWYAGVMANRSWGHIKFFGKPVPSVGSMGVNVTADKTLDEHWRGGVLALAVNLLGMLQSVWRFVELPLILVGAALAFRRSRPASIVLFSTVFYYLATLAVGHSEIRYGLPMQAIFIVFAGVAIAYLGERIRRVHHA